MTWDDVDDILYDGTEAEILSVRCPDCGGNIRYQYGADYGAFEIWCDNCGHYSRAMSSPKPNCAKFFGGKHTIK